MRGPHRALTILLLGLAAAHVAFAYLQPPPVAFGDETHYAKVAARDLQDGTLSLLPGSLRAAMRPELAARVFAELAGGLPLAEAGPDDESPAEGRKRAATVDGTALIGRVTPLHLLLHLATLALVFRQGRLLGLSGWASFAAAALLGLFPWFAFHVQALWPETIHAFLAALGLTALLAYQRRPRPLLLVPAGLALGYALLTKATLAPFVWVSLLSVAVWTPGARRAAGAVALLAGAVALVIVPQMSANRAAGFGFGLGANRWWNVELALRTPASVPAAAGDPYGLARWDLQREITDVYMAASRDPLQREAAARERSLAHVREQGWSTVVREQLAEFRDVLLARPGLAFYRAPCLEQALGYRARWGSPPPGWIAALSWPARPLWWVLLVLGLGGLVLGCRGDRRYWLPAAYALCVLLVALAAPLKFRFLLPLAPVLCLGLGRSVDALLSGPGVPRPERA